jgi:hypothetical protein
MKYALNAQKGSTVNHPVVGKLEGGKAYAIEDSEAEQLKHIIGIIIFDEVVEKKS